MPIIDYRCKNGHITTHMIPASKCGKDFPESERCRCSKCRCRAERIYDLGGPTVGFTDKSQTSIVLHLNTKTGEYSIPGQRDDELPGKNYKRVSITSMKQYEKIRRSVESTLLEEARFKQSIENQYFDQTAKQHREANRQRVEQAVAKGGHWVQYTDDKGITRTRWAPITPRALQLHDLACQQADRRRAEIRSKRQSQSANFHSRLLEYRESERSVVSGSAKRPQLPDLHELAERLEYQRRTGRKS